MHIFLVWISKLRENNIMTLNFVELRQRFVTNIHNGDTRRYVAALFVGKVLGIALVLLLMTSFLPHIAHAAQGSDVDTEQINAINTIWVLVAAFLVFGMQAGFVLLETGVARSRESLNIMVECMADTFICGITFWAWGFALMFGAGNGFFGKEFFFLQDTPLTYGATGIPVLAFWLFQFAFADTCSTITSGALVGRTGFIGDLLYSIGVTGFIYPIFGHWAWGPDGWLVTMDLPFRDFAGSTVVHTIGGAVSLAGAIVLGPRLGRVFKRDGGGPMPAHSLLLAGAGAFILWFGWYGFNPGSTLSAMDMQGIGRVAFNTTLAACSAGMVALLLSYFMTGGKWDLTMTINGFLAGLVAITAPCYWVEPTGAFFIGVIGAIVMIIAVELLEYFRIDDPIGAVPVHMAGGIWGTLAIGLFASGAYGLPGVTGADTSVTIEGLLYGGGVDQLVSQLIGSAAVTGATLAAAFALFYAIKVTGTLRVSLKGEIEGLDLHEHGATAYPEFLQELNDGTPKSVEEAKKGMFPKPGILDAASGD
jgi:ammonium transporter, Amt family